MNYFRNCRTIAEARKHRADLAKINHPDTGGNEDIMAEINKQFDEFVPQYADWDPSFQNSIPPHFTFNTINFTEEQLKQRIHNLIQQLRSYEEDFRNLKVEIVNAYAIHKNCHRDIHLLEEQIERLNDQLTCMENPYKISLWEYLKRRWKILCSK